METIFCPRENGGIIGQYEFVYFYKYTEGCLGLMINSRRNCCLRTNFKGSRIGNFKIIRKHHIHVRMSINMTCKFRYPRNPYNNINNNATGIAHTDLT